MSFSVDLALDLPEIIFMTKGSGFTGVCWVCLPDFLPPLKAIPLPQLLKYICPN